MKIGDGEEEGHHQVGGGAELERHWFAGLVFMPATRVQVVYRYDTYEYV